MAKKITLDDIHGDLSRTFQKPVTIIRNALNGNEGGLSTRIFRHVAAMPKQRRKKLAETYTPVHHHLEVA
jgi:hypothetical protein